PGLFALDAPITSPTYQFGLHGSASGSQATIFYKRYVEADDFRGVLAFTDWGFDIQDFDIRAASGSASGGSGWSAILTKNAQRVGHSTYRNVNISGGTGFNYSNVIDGSSNEQIGGPGYRDM